MVDNRTVILEGKRTPVGGWLVLASGVAIIVAGAVGAFGGEETFRNAIGLLVGSLLFGAMLIRAGQLLLLHKGGVLFDEQQRTLYLRGAGARDLMAIQAADISAIRVVPRDEVWGRVPTRNWSCELELPGRAAIAVGESVAYDGVMILARRLEGVLGVPLETCSAWCAPRPGEKPRTPPSATGRVEVRAGRRGRLAETLVTFGTVALAIGAVMIALVERAPVFGFLFGPTLLFLGLAMVLVALVGYLSHDVVEWTADEVSHHLRLGAISWGRKRLDREPKPYLRIHHRGLVGASLELVGPEQTVVLVGGVASRAGLGYDGLGKLAANLGADLWRAAADGADPEEP